MRVLCVAEKPSISKAVAGHLAGGSPEMRNTTDTFVKNYLFDFDFGPPWGQCAVTMTCVVGHLTNLEFPEAYSNWKYPPPDRLFDAPINIIVPNDKVNIARNIEQQARQAQALVIWTDCDLEGEYIGHEIRQAAWRGNARLEVKRARFSNIERAHILAAARRLGSIDERQVNAVSARIELDLRIGFAFSRFMCNNLRPLGGPLADIILSYGSCQFPTLGFVVDRYFRVKNFVPERFWAITMKHTRNHKTANFSWARHRLFDRAAVTILYERCLGASTAQVSQVRERPTRKLKPLPLTTVELQKAATRLLHITGQHTMSVAEGLYNKGFISYPRTETDRFDSAIDLRALVRKQTTDQRWGGFAQGLVDGAAGSFHPPRAGHHDDKAHPPIHPISYASPTVLSHDEGRLYEYVVRRFLACCADDAKGMATDVTIRYGDETFNAHGLVVLERNYLDVFVYERWTSSAELPRYTVGETFRPTEAMMNEGTTTPPGYLTEADLIALMDANGIGTDATMSEHIQKIQDREYVATRERQGGGNTDNGNEDDEGPRPARRARGGARGGRGGRGGGPRAGARAGGGGGVKEFLPTSLGVALIVGFDRMNFETSLGKPFLRKEMEATVRQIVAGQTTKEVVLSETISQYREVFEQSQMRLPVLRAACREFVLRA